MMYMIWHDAMVVMLGTQGGELLAYLSPRQLCTRVGCVAVEVSVRGGQAEAEVWEEDECGTR